jgi:hypothetical protein
MITVRLCCTVNFSPVDITYDLGIASGVDGLRT